MGCKWCSSGLGRHCDGPLGMDDLEVSCDCQCHECPDCHSAYCETMGGDEECGRHFDPDTGMRIVEPEWDNEPVEVRPVPTFRRRPAYRIGPQVRRLDEFC